MKKVIFSARPDGRHYSLTVKGLKGRRVKLKFAKQGDSVYLNVRQPMCRTILKHQIEVTNNGDLYVRALNLHSLQNLSIALLGSVGIPVTEVYRRNLRLYKPYHIELKELFGSIEVEYKAILS